MICCARLVGRGAGEKKETAVEQTQNPVAADAGGGGGKKKKKKKVQ